MWNVECSLVNGKERFVFAVISVPLLKSFFEACEFEN